MKDILFYNHYNFNRNRKTPHVKIADLPPFSKEKFYILTIRYRQTTSYFKSLQFYSQQENPYDELKPRAMMSNRNSLANSVNSQPRVSISSTNVPDATRRKSSSSAAQSRRGTEGNVYYSSVPVEDSVLLINNNQDRQQGDNTGGVVPREGVHEEEEEEFENRYSSRMASIIPMMSGIGTIVEEPEPEVVLTMEPPEAENDVESKI